MEWKTNAGRSFSSPAFEEEIRDYLQRRLRMMAGTLAILLSSLSAIFIATQVGSQGGILTQIVRFLTEFPNSILAMMAILTTSIYVVLRSRRLSSGMLAVLDGTFLQVLVFPCLLLYYQLHYFSFSGFPFVIPFLILFIMTRAVLVPSTLTRTVVLSLPAALGVLLIQFVRGESLFRPGEAYSGSHFVDMMVQNQVCLLGAIAVAAAASRVNMGLRRRNFDARKVGQYDLVEPIGAGAMGEVHLATHSLLKRPTAIKFLHPEITGAATLRRFEQEVRQTSRLSHPNTISIFDYGHTAEGVFFYAMEYLRGADLKEIVTRTGSMPPGRVIHILIQACSALHEAHTKGLVHRDIKPANLMLCHQGAEFDVVKVLDFGLVRDLQSDDPGLYPEGSVAGTPQTMAPETLRGQPATELSDIYSLGGVGYFLLTGQPIFSATTIPEFLEGHQNVPPIPLRKRDREIPEDLERIILECLEKNPAKRPQGARALRTALVRCASAGEWMQTDAESWWAEHAEELNEPSVAGGSDSVSASSVQTVISDSAATRLASGEVGPGPK